MTEVRDTNNPNSRKSSKRIPPKVKKYLKWGLIAGSICVLLGVLSIVALTSAVAAGAFGKLPTIEELQAIKNPTASEVYSADGVLLGRYYLENRTNVKYDEISKHAVNALVATEDARFFQHKGVDTRSVLRVFLKTILMGDRGSGGGSTINQQLIKNLYKRDNYGMLTIPVNKLKEIIVGRRLEKVFDKKDILKTYLNTVPFGERVFGIEAASQRYFSKTAKNLSLDEAATLIGMLKATTYYSPRRHPERSKTRRNVVINQMQKYGYISESQATTAKSFPLQLNYNLQSQSDGLAPHFRAALKKELQKWCEDNPKADDSQYNLFADGLKIYTTIDSKMQQYAQDAVKKHMGSLQKAFNAHWAGSYPWGSDQSLVKNAIRKTGRYKKLKKEGKLDSEIEREFELKTKMTILGINGEEVETMMSPKDSIIHYLKLLNTGFMVMEHKTGQIKAWVGSINHEYFPYDHTKSIRQVGSTFKPIVYASAIEHGVEPCNYYGNELRTYIDEYNNEWTPRNSDSYYEGEYSMKGGLAKSVNTISVQILYDTGVDTIIQLARDMGIKNDIPAYPSIALGTPELSLQEMLQAYGTFANGGYKVEPKYIREIKTHNNKSLAKFPVYNSSNERILNANTANLMVEMLQGVVDSGTGRRIRFLYNLDQDFGGKTGTTQNQTDGWFIGITPDLVAGVWTGGQTRLIRFRTIDLGQGSNMALPIYGEFFKKLYNDKDYQKLANAQFREPGTYLEDKLACDYWRDGPPEVLADVEVDPEFQSRIDDLLKKRKMGQNNPRQTPSRSGSRITKSSRKIGTKEEQRPKNEKEKPKKKRSIWKRIFGGGD